MAEFPLTYPVIDIVTVFEKVFNWLAITGTIAFAVLEKEPVQPELLPPLITFVAVQVPPLTVVSLTVKLVGVTAFVDTKNTVEPGVELSITVCEVEFPEIVQVGAVFVVPALKYTIAPLAVNALAEANVIASCI